MRRRLTLRDAVWLLVGGVLLFLLALALVPPERSRVDRVALVVLVLYACLLARGGYGVGDRPRPRPPDPPVVGELSPAAEQDVRLARLDASLVHSTVSGSQWARAAAPMLRRLATERLHDKHGIDAVTDPAAARRVLGEELWPIFANPPDDGAAPPPPERLAAYVAAVERL